MRSASGAGSLQASELSTYSDREADADFVEGILTHRAYSDADGRLSSSEERVFVTFHRFGLLLTLLSVLALGLSGFAPNPAVDLTADSHAEMAMDQHECCPEGVMDEMSMMHEGDRMPCPSMDDCANGPCGLASISLAFVLNGVEHSRIVHASAPHAWRVDRFHDAVEPTLDHPPRA